jgi:hypothetical protein
MKGAPVMSIKELAGHRDIATTLRYMHLAKGRRPPPSPCSTGQAMPEFLAQYGHRRSVPNESPTIVSK